MKKTYFFIALILFSVNNYAQVSSNGFWKKIKISEKIKHQKNSSARNDLNTYPKAFEVYSLDVEKFKSKLSEIRTSKKEVAFPINNGVFERFNLTESSILAPELQKQFPTIKSYRGQGIDDPTATIRISVSKHSIHIMVLSGEKSALFIDPFLKEESSFMVYNKKDVPINTSLKCLVTDLNQNKSNFNVKSKNLNANDGKLRTFKLALAATGEYSQFHLTDQGIGVGETDIVKKEAVLSAMNTTMSRVNGVFERDLSITMVIVANNTNIIYLDGNTDPFDNSNASVLINQSQSVIDTEILDANYDIGHTFSTGGGGLASLNSPCVTGAKARGITGSPSPKGDPYDIDFVAHEMGHQFGSNHTFNGDAGNCGGGTRNNSTAVEPGSGTTIMAYAGICSPQNVQPNSDFYFHSISIQEMWLNISAGSSNCVIPTNTINENVPTVNAGVDFTIPKSTPFVLTGVGGDLDGDAITYCWEQIDNDINPVPLLSTSAAGPTFRSFSPTISDKRFFPNLTTLLNGEVSSVWEVMPSVTRDLDFSLTVRDNNLEGGQSARDDMTVSIDGTVGPLTVTSQSTSGITWLSGTDKTINWLVNNTNTLTGASNVNIMLSIDGGLTYPIALASDVPNNGSAVISVPNNPAPYCRVMVQPTNNVFFNINAESFALDYTITTNCTTYSATPNLSITDNSTNFDTTIINIPDNTEISDVNVTIDIDHAYMGDLDIKVSSPSLTEIKLFERQCASNDNLNVVFDDEGINLVCAPSINGTYLPSELLAGVDSEMSGGDWTLSIKDNEIADTGILNSWAVEICISTETLLAVSEFDLGKLITYPNPVNNKLYLSISNILLEDLNVKMYDVLGREVLSKQFNIDEINNVKEIDIEHLAVGSYILKVSSGSAITSRRVVKI